MATLPDLHGFSSPHSDVWRKSLRQLVSLLQAQSVSGPAPSPHPSEQQRLLAMEVLLNCALGLAPSNSLAPTSSKPSSLYPDAKTKHGEAVYAEAGLDNAERASHIANQRLIDEAQCILIWAMSMYPQTFTVKNLLSAIIRRVNALKPSDASNGPCYIYAAKLIWDLVWEYFEPDSRTKSERVGSELKDSVSNHTGNQPKQRLELLDMDLDLSIAHPLSRLATGSPETLPHILCLVRNQLICIDPISKSNDEQSRSFEKIWPFLWYLSSTQWTCTISQYGDEVFRLYCDLGRAGSAWMRQHMLVLVGRSTERLRREPSRESAALFSEILDLSWEIMTTADETMPSFSNNVVAFRFCISILDTIVVHWRIGYPVGCLVKKLIMFTNRLHISSRFMRLAIASMIGVGDMFKSSNLDFITAFGAEHGKLVSFFAGLETIGLGLVKLSTCALESKGWLSAAEEEAIKYFVNYASQFPPTTGGKEEGEGEGDSSPKSENDFDNVLEIEWLHSKELQAYFLYFSKVNSTSTMNLVPPAMFSTQQSCPLILYPLHFLVICGHIFQLSMSPSSNSRNGLKDLSLHLSQLVFMAHNQPKLLDTILNVILILLKGEGSEAGHSTLKIKNVVLKSLVELISVEDGHGIGDGSIVGFGSKKVCVLLGKLMHANRGIRVFLLPLLAAKLIEYRRNPMVFELLQSQLPVLLSALTRQAEPKVSRVEQIAFAACVYLLAQIEHKDAFLKYSLTMTIQFFRQLASSKAKYENSSLICEHAIGLLVDALHVLCRNSVVEPKLVWSSIIKEYILSDTILSRSRLINERILVFASVFTTMVIIDQTTLNSKEEKDQPIEPTIIEIVEYIKIHLLSNELSLVNMASESLSILSGPNSMLRPKLASETRHDSPQLLPTFAEILTHIQMLLPQLDKVQGKRCKAVLGNLEGIIRLMANFVNCEVSQMPRSLFIGSYGSSIQTGTPKGQSCPITSSGSLEEGIKKMLFTEPSSTSIPTNFVSLLTMLRYELSSTSKNFDNVQTSNQSAKCFGFSKLFAAIPSTIQLHWSLKLCLIPALVEYMQAYISWRIEEAGQGTSLVEVYKEATDVLHQIHLNVMTNLEANKSPPSPTTASSIICYQSAFEIVRFMLSGSKSNLEQFVHGLASSFSNDKNFDATLLVGQTKELNFLPIYEYYSSSQGVTNDEVMTAVVLSLASVAKYAPELISASNLVMEFVDQIISTVEWTGIKNANAGAAWYSLLGCLLLGPVSKKGHILGQRFIDNFNSLYDENRDKILLAYSLILFGTSFDKHDGVEGLSINTTAMMEILKTKIDLLLSKERLDPTGDPYKIQSLMLVIHTLVNMVDHRQLEVSIPKEYLDKLALLQARSLMTEPMEFKNINGILLGSLTERNYNHKDEDRKKFWQEKIGLVAANRPVAIKLDAILMLASGAFGFPFANIMKCKRLVVEELFSNQINETLKKCGIGEKQDNLVLDVRLQPWIVLLSVQQISHAQTDKEPSCSDASSSEFANTIAGRFGASSAISATVKYIESENMHMLLISMLAKVKTLPRIDWGRIECISSFLDRSIKVEIKLAVKMVEFICKHVYSANPTGGFHTSPYLAEMLKKIILKGCWLEYSEKVNKSCIDEGSVVVVDTIVASLTNWIHAFTPSEQGELLIALVVQLNEAKEPYRPKIFRVIRQFGQKLCQAATNLLAIPTELKKTILEILANQIDKRVMLTVKIEEWEELARLIGTLCNSLWNDVGCELVNQNHLIQLATDLSLADEHTANMTHGGSKSFDPKSFLSHLAKEMPRPDTNSCLVKSADEFILSQYLGFRLGCLVSQGSIRLTDVLIRVLDLALLKPRLVGLVLNIAIHWVVQWSEAWIIKLGCPIGWMPLYGCNGQEKLSTGHQIVARIDGQLEVGQLSDLFQMAWKMACEATAPFPLHQKVSKRICRIMEHYDWEDVEDAEPLQRVFLNAFY